MYFNYLSNNDLCRFCLAESDKSAVTLKDPQILVCVDKKVVDLKQILQLLCLNSIYCETLPNLICNDCKTIIIKYYSLKNTFLENEKTLTVKSSSLKKHQRLQNLIRLVERFCSTLNDEDSLNIVKYGNKIIIEKLSDLGQLEDKTISCKEESQDEETLVYDQYFEEYIEDDDIPKSQSETNMTQEFEEQTLLFEEDDTINEVKTVKSHETDYEIESLTNQTSGENEQHEDTKNILFPEYDNEPLDESKFKIKTKRKNRAIIENMESGHIAKKFKISLVDSTVVVQEDNINNSFMCSNCSTIFSNEKSANEHVTKYGKFQFCTKCRCNECSMIFQSEKLYQRHKSHHILSKISSSFNYYDCLTCNCSFGNEKDYKKHLEQHQRNENYLFTFDGKPQLEGCDVLSKNQKYEEGYWSCGHCGLQFPFKNELNFHLTLFHATLYCPFDKQSYGKSLSYLIDHVKTKHPEQFSCEDITFNCSHCFSEFTSKSEMKEHEKFCDSKKFECDHCGKKYGLERQLKEHLETVNGNMKFSCSFCDKKFTNKSSMTVHLRIHSQEKPYVCTYLNCYKTFRTNSHRNAHMDAHNATKNFKCLYCDYMFQTRAAKRAHEKSHCYSHICPLCHKDFKQRSHLVRHVNIVHKIKCGSGSLESEINKKNFDDENI